MVAPDPIPNQVHELKCWPRFFEAIRIGQKTVEVRREDDRRYLTGDVLRLREWDPKTEEYSGRVQEVLVQHELRCGDVEGLPEDLVILSILRVRPARELVTTVQALQDWLRHKPECESAPMFGPDHEACTCGLAEEWGRRFFPLGALGDVFHRIRRGDDVDQAVLESLPPWWGQLARELIGKLGISVSRAPELEP